MTIYAGFLALCMMGSCQTFKSDEVYHSEAECIADLENKRDDFVVRLRAKAMAEGVQAMPPMKIGVGCKKEEAA